MSKKKKSMPLLGQTTTTTSTNRHIYIYILFLFALLYHKVKSLEIKVDNIKNTLKQKLVVFSMNIHSFFIH
jgi:hypothetical protein